MMNAHVPARRPSHSHHFRSPTQVALLSSVDLSEPASPESISSYPPPPAYDDSDRPPESPYGSPHIKTHAKVHVHRPPGPSDLSPTRITVVLTLLYIATIFYGIDGTVVATLTTPIASGFNQLNRAAWLNSAYLLSVACFTPLYGRLSDIMGRRFAVVVGLGLFALGSALCGFSNSMGMLIFARLIQGAGGGGSGMLGSIIISDVVSLRTRGLLNGVGSVCWAVGSGLGGVYGGLVADTLGWRWAFLLQVPALLVLMFALGATVNYVVPGQTGTLRAMGRRIDWSGSALLILWIGSFVCAMAFKTNEDLPFSHPLVYLTFLFSLVALIMFVIVEVYYAPEPVIEFALLKDLGRLGIVNGVWLAASATISLNLFFPMLLQIVRGNSASVAGMHLIPNTVASAIGGVLSGLYIRTTGKYYYMLMCLGVLQLLPCFVLSTFDGRTWEFFTWVVLMPQRFASSGFNGTLVLAMLATINRSEIAQITSIRFMFQSCGHVLGMALSAAIQQTVLASELAEHISGDDAAAIISEVRRNATAILDLPPDVQVATVAAYTTSLHSVFIVNGSLALAAILFVACVKEYPLTDKPEKTDNEYKLAVGDDSDNDEEEDTAL